MFNRTEVYRGATKYVPYDKTITENKAPTDESIRLLNEFEDKAMKNILYKVNIESNSLNAVSIVIREEFETQRIKQIIRFNLNGKDYLFQEYISKQELLKSNGEEAMLNTIQKVYEKIIGNIVVSLFVENVGEILKLSRVIK